MLFDISGRRRAGIRWIYATLATVMAVGFVGFGVGSDVGARAVQLGPLELASAGERGVIRSQRGALMRIADAGARARRGG